MEQKNINIQEQYLKTFVETLRPQDPEIRKQVDIGYSWENNTAILFEIRPKWDHPEELMNTEFAKIRYTKTQKEYKLYWMRGTGKWEIYEPFPTATNLQELLNVIKEDAHSCFFG